jgi:hypothetical protein
MSHELADLDAAYDHRVTMQSRNHEKEPTMNPDVTRKRYHLNIAVEVYADNDNEASTITDDLIHALKGQPEVLAAYGDDRGDGYVQPTEEG